jgi:hypothetical protein
MSAVIGAIVVSWLQVVGGAAWGLALDSVGLLTGVAPDPLGALPLAHVLGGVAVEHQMLKQLEQPN